MIEDIKDILFSRGIMRLIIIVGVILLFYKSCGSCSSKHSDPQPAPTPLFEKYTYLVNEFEPVSSNQCKVYKYNRSHDEEIKMATGEMGYGGFNIDEEDAFITFNIGGGYDRLTFRMGHYYRCSEKTGIVTVRADGKKILDEKVRGYEAPRSYSLDVSGVNEITFEVTAGYIDVMVADAILWKKGETPVEVYAKPQPRTAPMELVKELKPYYMTSFMDTITDCSDSQIKINQRVYEYGLRGNMDMALIGTNKGNAYFHLRKEFSKLRFITGCHDDVTGRSGAGWVTVKADGKIIKEIDIREGDIAKQVVLDITGCEILSFHTEQYEGNSDAEIAQIMVYPNGYAVTDYGAEMGIAPPDPRLKELPDVCKLISNIRPYQVVGVIEKQIYDGASDYLTFSMGGYKFSEGIILYEKASFLNDNLSASATFDLGNEFDYISFTAGYVGKSWNMNNDELMVFADNELVFTTPLVATYPNRHFTIPIKKCRILRFANRGCGRLDVAAFGVGDIVVYRGEPVENNLFARTVPECPYEIDLIDLGLPYIHYVSTKEDDREETICDGTTMKRYFEIDGQRIYKGFILQTSTHFSLDFGVLGDDGSATAAGLVGATAVGASFVASGVAVGGVAVGTTLAPLGAMLMLAAGGEAVENSLAAFNTYGEYNSVTFKVACLPMASVKSKEPEHLMIGADHNVMANIALYETMEPTEFTVPIDKCEQLIFWLSNTRGTSAQYLIYDIVVSKEKRLLKIPERSRYELPQLEQ